ncbi:hypothetical protein [Intestinibacillus massiliensis]|uniref:hypothetical protein n=1 Tax=Intestinibacillus massiliensis TaxID=1871029 RepID=UPI000B351CDF|nr:hypothetical protein [Intestinibacillus massiliensis]
MALERMAFNPEQGFADAAAYPDPTNEEEVREQLMRPQMQLRDYINTVLLTALESAAGAANIGGAAVGKLPAGNMQGLLQALYDWFTEAGGAGRVGVKAVKDVQGDTVQTALEGVQANLVAYRQQLQGSQGARAIGVSQYPGIPEGTLQAVLESLAGQIRDVNAGIIPDFGVTWAKLAQDVADMIEAVSASQTSGELDDYRMETGTFQNAGAGWNTFRFREAFDEAPRVTVTAYDFAGFVMVKGVTAEGFLYCLRIPGWSGGTPGSVSSEKVFVGAATGTSPAHNEKTVVTAVNLPTMQTATTATTSAAVEIGYIAVEYGGDI